jgi:RNA polymerase sigma factor (sigma-70 family)
MPNDEFQPLPDHALARCDDQALLAYITAARGADIAHESTRGLWHLVDRHVDRVKARLRLRVPDHLLDDMTHDVLVDAIEAALAGRKIENLNAWLNRVIENTRAEFYRGKHYRQLQHDREAASLDRDDDAGKPAPAREEGVEGDYGAAELRDLIVQLLGDRSDTHRAVIELYIFEDLTAKDVTAQTGESENNIYKIAERFRTDLRELLEDAEPVTDPAPGPAAPGRSPGDTGRAP